MWKPQKTMSNTANLSREGWINPESRTQKWEITLADLNEKQCHGNTLLSKDYIHVHVTITSKETVKK